MSGTLSRPALFLIVALAFSVVGHATASSARESRSLSAFAAADAPGGFAGLCATYPWACSSASGKRRFSAQAMLALAQEVNRAVNSEIKPLSDLDNHGVPEKWTLPYNGFGDCEDYALLKMKRLIDAGAAPRDLFFATVVRDNDAVHVVLVVRTSAGDYVLDNLTERMLPWEQTRYTFLKKQDPARPSRWSVVLLGPRASRS